jgi:hypothetical protein
MSAVRLLLSALRRPLLVHTYRSLPHRRQFSFTAWPRATETKVTPPQNANPGLDEVPQEILGEIPQEVHEEMRELGTAYSAQIQKLLESPEALNALKDLKRSVESLGTLFYVHDLSSCVLIAKQVLTSGKVNTLVPCR